MTRLYNCSACADTGRCRHVADSGTYEEYPAREGEPAFPCRSCDAGTVPTPHATVEPPESSFYTLEWEHKRQIAIAVQTAREADPAWQLERDRKRAEMRARVINRRTA